MPRLNLADAALSACYLLLITVTAGGVSLKEIDMKTMQSKLCPGLFFCGELIDVDGVTGGFNFAGCWSTGYLAGTNAAKNVQQFQMQQESK